MLNILIKNLSKLKTASIYKKSSIIVYDYNKNFIQIIKILYQQGFIKSFFIFKKKLKKKYIAGIYIFLKYSIITNRGLLDSLKIVSKQSIKVNVQYVDLCKIRKKNKFYLFSTFKGFIHLEACLKNRIGGQLLFII